MPSAPSNRASIVVGGRYRIEELIGRGGQSTVYRAVDLRDGDEVALKILKGEFAADPDFRERMFREAHAMAQLHGTASIRVLDQCWTDEGQLCLVTELLHGVDLETFLANMQRAKMVMQSDHLVELLDPIARTLELAHTKGIVHRDLKPANIHVIRPEYGGGTRLLDFGFAKFTRARSFTAQGMVAGSPSYIPPEAWSGSSSLDHRVDVYGFGAIIFRCLTGRPPFESPNLPDLLLLVTTAERPSLHALRPDLPWQLDDWVRQALSIRPEDRFQTITPLWRAFRGTVGV